MLWDMLTGREHLVFYGRLKNLKGAALEQAVEESLKSVNLYHGGVGDKQARKYSGGMKRRLSVAISIDWRSQKVAVKMLSPHPTKTNFWLRNLGLSSTDLAGQISNNVRGLGRFNSGLKGRMGFPHLEILEWFGARWDNRLTYYMHWRVIGDPWS
ncbi:ABC transporter A family member 7 [Acorus calamus]|uniref:ABC transporter A family member 7 n=1 Tax=Acorus calamus TaxID=4465 RepID=A0AAV9DCD3_ACOCL|nr:ABC transporter A family member 7 [Acorus calamus]